MIPNYTKKGARRMAYFSEVPPESALEIEGEDAA